MKTLSDLAILIVEDEPVQRRFLAETLQEMGATTVLQANNGGQAVEIMNAVTIDLVFCDIGMPHVDGSQLMLQQAERADLVPSGARAGQVPPMLVWMSALGECILQSHCHLARVAGYAAVDAVGKPLSPTSIRVVIDRLMVQWQTQGKSTPARPGGVISDDDLLSAICDNGEFDIWYRPRVSLDDGSMVAAQATVRWAHPQLRALDAQQCADLVEQQGLGLVLFYRTINQVLKMHGRLQDAHIAMPICVSVSADVLQTPEIADYLAERVAQSRLCAEHCIIVVSNLDAKLNVVRLWTTINRLRIKGFVLQLDGFGGGAASLGTLLQLPFSGVCIDGALIARMGRHLPSRYLVETIIDLGRKLDLSVVANGVTSQESGRVLHALGCLQAQGAIAGLLSADDLVKAISARQQRCL